MNNIKNISQQIGNWYNKSNQKVTIGASTTNEEGIMGAVTLPNFKPLTQEEKNIEKPNLFNDFSLDIQKFREKQLTGYQLFMKFKDFLYKLNPNRLEGDRDKLIDEKIIDILNNVTNAIITINQDKYTPYAERFEVLPIIMMTYLRTNEFCDDNKMLNFAKNNQFIKLVANNVKPRIQEEYAEELEDYNQWYGGGGLGERNIRKMINDIGDDIRELKDKHFSDYYTKFSALDISSNTVEFGNWGKLNSKEKRSLLIQELNNFTSTLSDNNLITENRSKLRTEIESLQFKDKTESNIEVSGNRLALKEISMLLHPDKLKTVNSTLFYSYIKSKLQQ